MGSVQTFGRAEQGRRKPACQPSWSSDEPPSVALPAFDADPARQGHGRSQVHRPRRSGTPRDLRLASSLSWELSTQLTTLCFRGGGNTHSSGTIFCSGSSTPALFSECAATLRAGHQTGIFPYSLKNGYASHSPPAPIFCKWSRAAANNALCMYHASRRQTGRWYQNNEKKPLGIEPSGL